MALSGKFLADFESFYAATRKAEVELRSMETGAGKVGASLNKMVDGFSGRKLVQDATLVTEAVERIGGASKLTESEQSKVNRTVTEAIAKYSALGQTAPPAMLALANATKAVEQPTSRVNSYMNDLTNQVKATALGFISAQAVIGGVTTGFRALTAFVGSSIESFAAAEAAQKKLTTALQAQGTATPAVISQYDKLATQFQKTTVFSDDLVTEMQGLLVQVGNVMPSEMNKALTAATDLASGLGIDLRQATMLVGKAFEGETGTLKRYGIVIDEAKLKAGGMPVVLDAIQARFGGQAAAEIDTYAGRVKQLANEWDNLKEKVGGYIATDPVLLAAMRGAAGAAEANDKGVTGWNVAMSVMAASTPAWLVALKNIHGDLVPIAEAANSAAAAMKLIKPPALFSPGAGPTAPTGGPDPKALVEQWAKDQKKAEAAAKAAAEAAKQAAKAFRDMADAMSGAKAIAAANEQLKLIAFNMQRGVPLAKMTRETQDAINKSMTDAVFVYAKLGKQVPADISAVYFATLDMSKGIPIVAGLSAEFAKLGTVVPFVKELMARPVAGLSAEFGRIGEIVQRQIIPPMNEWATQLDGLARSLSQLATISGTTFGGIIRDLATLVSATDAATKGFASFKAGKKEGFNLAGILEMSSGILGIASAALAAGKAIKNMFFGSEGRDLVKDFAGSMGGFDALRETLNGLGAEGERLWVALTQGVGKNNPTQAQAAIDAITAALAKQKDAIDGLSGAAPTMAAIRSGMAPDELAALAAGYQQAVVEGFKGGQDAFLKQQLEFYGQLEEGDARLKTFFYGDTLAEFAGQMGDSAAKAMDALRKFMDPDEIHALAAGYKSALSEGFTGSEDEFLKQQLEYYGKLQEGDARLKTYFMGNTLNAFNLIAAGQGELAEKLLGNLGKLDDQIKSLNDSIASEAPEEIMGVIEANTRAQIAGIQKERDAAQLALEQTAGDAARTAEEAAKLIEQTLGAHDFRVKVKIDLDDPSGILSGKVAGGILSRGSGSYGPVGDSGNITIVSQTVLDGEVLAESLATTLKRQGVR